MDVSISKVFIYTGVETDPTRSGGDHGALQLTFNICCWCFGWPTICARFVYLMEWWCVIIKHNIISFILTLTALSVYI